MRCLMAVRDTKVQFVLQRILRLQPSSNSQLELSPARANVPVSALTSTVASPRPHDFEGVL
jgi:hypothetical protein